MHEESSRGRLNTFLDELRQDWKYSLRTLPRSPGFLIGIVLTLGVGIGANVLIFSVVYGVLLRPLPYRDADSLVTIWQVSKGASAESQAGSQRRRTGWQGTVGNGRSPELAPGDFVNIREQGAAWGDVIGAEPWSYVISSSGDPLTLRAWRVTRGFFEAVGMPPLLGRTFLPEEYRRNEQVVLLSQDFWQTRFASNPSIVGGEVTLSGSVYRVIGVMPRTFQLPVGGYWSSIDLWTPNSEEGYIRDLRESSFWPVMARLKPGVTLQQVDAELNRVGVRLSEQFPATNAGRQFQVVPLRKHLVGTLQPILMVLLVAGGLVLIAVCANIANLLLVKGSRRRRELGVRMALGASRARIICQIMVENTLMTLAGAGLGLLLSYVAIPFLLQANPASSPLFDGIALNGPVFIFAVLLSCAALVLFGLGPSFQFASNRIVRSLGLGPSTVGDSRASQQLRGLLVIGQVAMAVTLTVGAGLFVRTLWNLLSIDPGFRTEGILTAQLDFTAYVRGPANAVAFVDRVMERMRAIPGVTDVSAVSNLPMHDTPVDYRDEFSIVSSLDPPLVRSGKVLHTIVSGPYFESMGIPLKAGRMFGRVGQDTPKVALISAALAKQYWGKGNPIGAQIKLGYPANYVAEVIGVVGDVKHRRLDEVAGGEIYIPHEKTPVRQMTFLLSTKLQPVSLIPAVRRLLKESMPVMPLGQIAPLDHFISESVRPEHFVAMLTGIFAVAVLLLAAIGQYSLVSYTIELRKSEIGVAMALGAQGTDILRAVLTRGMGLTAVGLLAGLVIAFEANRVVSTLLFGITAADPSTYGIAALMVLAAGTVACLIPARRAAEVDPIRAIRNT